MIIIISVIVFCYIVPCILGYNYVRIAHSKEGIYSSMYPSNVDLFLVFFFPILFYFLWISDYPKYRKDGLSKFFNIKK